MLGDERLLTVPQVARRLQVGVRTVQRYIREGRLHGFLLGGTKTGYRVLESEVRRFLAEAAKSGEGKPQ